MTLQIALATDGRMVDAALVVLGSVLEHASRDVTLHLLGYHLSPLQRRQFDTFCVAKHCSLVFHEVEDSLFGAAQQTNDDIPLVAMARMFLPQWVSGRVLYLDCDMLVLADVAAVFDADLGDALIGAVRDFYVLDQLKQGAERPEKLTYHREVLGRDDVSGYFNSGLLLLECDRIRQDEALCAAMTDLAAANGYRFMDQDRLNVLFGGKTAYLPLAWNDIWGRAKKRAATVAQLPWLPVAETEPMATQLIHYTGPKKPWKKQSALSVALRGRWTALAKWRAARSRTLG